MKIVYFLRHGQTDWNLAGRWQSRSEIPLNQTGRAQSRALAKVMQRQSEGWSKLPQHIVCSPMARAQNTARQVAEALALEVVVEPRFIELDLGAFEGRLHTDLLKQEGERFEKWFESVHRLAPPDGESLEDGMRRVQSAFQAHLDSAQEAEMPLVIVAHQGINIAMKTLLSGQQADRVQAADLKRYKQANFEVDVWQQDNGAWQFVRREQVDEFAT